ncbi:MAG: beta strand repeat-containing protein, partial [Pseudobdellovibrionaceae bacterium]
GSITNADIASLAWSKLTGTPTTLAGYGVTDAIKNLGTIPGASSGLDAAKPGSPALGELYIAVDTGKIYRWDGTSTWAVMATKDGAVNNTANLATTKVWIGNASGVAQEFSLTGDATMTSGGVVTVDKTQSAAASKILQLDASSVAVTKGTDIGGASTGKVSLRYPSTATDTTLTFPSSAGSANQVLQTDGAGNLSWASPSGSSTGFVNGGNSFGANSSLGNNDNFNFDLKTNNTSRMTILNNGNVGIGTATPGSTLDVKGTLRLSGATSGFVGFAPAATAGSMIYTLPTTQGSAGQVLSTDGVAGTPTLSWVTPSSSSLPGLASTQVWVGNASGSAVAVSLSGDIASITNAGVVTANKTTTAQANKLLVLDGTGVASSMGNQLNGSTSGSVTLQAAGITTNYSLTFPAAQGSSGQTLSNNGSGALSWVTPLSSSTGFENGGNTFAGNSSLGNNDNFNLDLKTNNTSRMTLLNNGNVGIGTSIPQAALDVVGTTNLTSALIVPRATTADRPSTAVNGMIRYNSDTNSFEAYQSGQWVNMIASIGSTGGAHRYWAIRVTASGNGNSSLSEIELRQTSQGVNEAQSAISNYPNTNNGNYLEANAINGLQRITYDFGSGVTKTITEVLLVPRNDGWSTAEAPTSFDVQYSDDGTTWSTAWTQNVSSTNWGSAAALQFTNPAVTKGKEKRYWRINNWVPQSGGVAGANFMQVRETPGGGDIFTAATSSWIQGTTNSGSALRTHTNADIGTNTGVTFYWGTTPHAINEVVITARNDSWWQQIPVSFNVQSSFDGITWTTEWTVSGLSWTSGETKIISNSASATSYMALDGTASAVGFGFAQDQNTGLFRPSADTLAVSSGGIERLRVDSAGNIGIGTAVPGYKLDVAGDVNVTGNFKVNGVNIATGSGVTAVTATAPLTSSGGSTPGISISQATTSTDGYLSFTDWNTFNSKLSAVAGSTLSSGKIWVGDGTNQAAAVIPSSDLSMSNAGAFTVTKIQSRNIDSAAPSDGQVLLWDNTNITWKPQYVRMQDIRNAWGGTQMIPSSSCAANQSMVWSVVTDRFTCQNIDSLDASKITTGTINSARLPAQPYVIGGTFTDVLANSQVLTQHPFPINVTIPANCASSRFEFSVAATASTIISLQKCTGSGFTSCTQFGTAVVSAGGKVASFTCASATSFVGGTDSLLITGPASADATAATAGWAIYGTR